jgi:activator of Hsp90 ATPase-like protein
MKTKHFTATIRVDATPQEAFDAINDVRGWWSGQIEGRTDVLGAEFTYRYKKLHRTTQKITELVPGKKIVWHVTDSHIDFVRDTSEWDGTDIVFEIAKKGDETEIRFTHVGLVPTIECYDGCSGAWGFYVNESLRSFIAEGKGQPNQDERRPRLAKTSPAKSGGEPRAHELRR